MNVVAERSKSLWMGTSVAAAPTLDRAEKADTIVVGSGIAGLSVAYELCVRGQSVVVIDRGEIGGGMTARTTAHLSSSIDDSYDALIKLRGVDQAREYYLSQEAAIARMQANSQQGGIDCDFRRVDAYLFVAPGSDPQELEREYDASQAVGLQVEWADEAPLRSMSTGRCLQLPNQARIHPLKYLHGLANEIIRRNGRLYANTRVDSIEETDKGVVVTTAFGHQAKAEAAVIATNSPINELVAIHTKQAPYRTYAFAAEIASGVVPDALYWDTYDPYHYVRLQPGSNGRDFLIVGGADHKTGEADEQEVRFAGLESWARDWFPQIEKITHRWSGQVYEPIDAVGFVGLNPGNKRTFVCTGDSGEGITNGVVGGLLISRLILDGRSDWTAVYEPSRKPLRATGTFLEENATMLKNLSEHVRPGDVGSVDELKPGEGAVVRSGLKKIAAYRDANGQLHLRSAVCTNLGCVVHWNPFERCWDCPCHGSQFSTDGEALQGPAVFPLAEGPI
jgi:glycine/D-amino acid oxidase-like deaminating enzyme/nitrite reductase/ring-hydroxylating ferredoxin subunit